MNVGGSPCTSPEATDDAISCDPPEKPREIDGNGNSKVMVGLLIENIGQMWE